MLLLQERVRKVGGQAWPASSATSQMSRAAAKTGACSSPPLPLEVGVPLQHGSRWAANIVVVLRLRRQQQLQPPMQ